jgi:hypothetical protein
MVYVIDFIGVKAKRSDKRYVARSYPLSSLDDLPGQLRLERPILAGVQVFESWFREPASKYAGFAPFLARSAFGQHDTGCLFRLLPLDKIRCQT